MEAKNVSRQPANSRLKQAQTLAVPRGLLLGLWTTWHVSAPLGRRGCSSIYMCTR